MIFHNIKQIVRSLWRYKSFSLINFLGLSLGISAIVIIFLVADYERSFDTFHSNRHIYRVGSKTNRADGIQYSAAVPYTLGRLLRAEYAGATATQLHYVREMNIKISGQEPVQEKNILFADSLFFNVLDFGKIKNLWIRGNPEIALKDPKKIILTESTAKKYFGKTDPIGKLIRLENKADAEVVAIIKDPPVTSHLPFNMIVSFSTLTKEFLAGIDIEQWGVRSHGFCYVHLANPADEKQVERTLQSIVKKNAESDMDKKEILFLQPVRDIHFNKQFEISNPTYTVSQRYLTMLMLLGGFIILIACINYINLSTSLAFTKANEIGIRKSIGASRQQLFFFYMLETFFITAVATLIGIVLTILLLPSVNQLMDKTVSIDRLLNIRFIAEGAGILLLISFISGAYPAIILSGFNPIESLKSKVVLPGKFSTIMRQSLVVFQFTTSITLIICTITIARQRNYFNSKPLGFNKDAVVEVALPEPDSTKREHFYNLLQHEKGIRNISFCLGAPISDNGFNTSFQAPELTAGTEQNVKIIPCDAKYPATYGIKLVAGRWFLPGEEKNSGTGFVVNETLVKTLGYRNPQLAIGKKITIGINDMNAPILGVTADFHVNSLHEGIMPCIMMPFPYFYYAAGIKINPSDMKTTLANIEKIWKSIYPESVYEYKFIDETLARSYEQENKDYALFKTFSIVSIFICCIGLWGLITFVVVRKTKEIGIRKVLGASIKAIVLLLSKDSFKLVSVALLIASPVAWYFMNRWLQDFAYRINVSWWIFLLAGVIAVLIALVTISFQAIKAAVANPVKSLRTE